MDDIFISIASYRDSELGPTIDDCVAKAHHPERLRFGVCWQHETREPTPSCFDQRVDVMAVHWSESRGMCWARAETMKMWRGERWFLQIDSHHRFVDGWDSVLLDQIARCPSSRPVLTTYAPAYTPDGPLKQDSSPMQINFDGFSDDGIALLRPGPIHNWRADQRPRRGRFASGHFFFAPGQFARDVPWDPELFYTGDECILAVRTFTAGYDLFVPARLVMWHRYFTAGTRRRHWDDHENGATASERLEVQSRRKIAHLLSEPWIGVDGLGSHRTLADYERYAGISFRHRIVQPHARFGREPPSPSLGYDDVAQADSAGSDASNEGPVGDGLSRLVDLFLDQVREDLAVLMHSPVERASDP